MKTDKKKKIIKVLVSLAIVLVVCLAINFALSLFTPKVGFTDRRDDIFYFPIDYNEDIFDDLVYVSKNRNLKFDYYGSTIIINEENFEFQSPEARFFYDYFNIVISGDSKAYKNLFHESFFKNYSIPEKFTMQKVYDIEVTSMTSNIENGVAFETYKVSYKIYENNGTFRADVSSDESKPVAITLIKGGELKIASIVPIL